MNKEDKQVLNTASRLINLILGSGNLSPEAAYDILLINGGNTKVLYEHIKALAGIFSKAQKLMEDNDLIHDKDLEE